MYRLVSDSSTPPSMMDRNFINVLILGVSFMFLFTSFQTGGIIQGTVVKSIQQDDPNYKPNANISVAIIYAVLAIANWLAPAVVGLLGPRLAMIISGVTYCLFTANFLYPLTIGLYTVSVIVGLGAAVIWTSQGTYLTMCSTKENMSRNSSLFWALLQCSFLWGNIFVYFTFKDSQDKINSSTRMLTYSVLTAVGGLGVICFFFLGEPRQENSSEDSEKNENKVSVAYIVQSLKDSFNLLKTQQMLLLFLTFIYTGLELGFFSIVYSTTVGNSTSLDPEGSSSKKFVGLVGMLIGIGEIVGGLSFGILGEKFKKIGRNPIVILGYAVHVAAFVLIALIFAKDANMSNTTETGVIKGSLAIALLVAFMLGFADACFNTQVYSIIGVLYSDKSSSAFALFKFSQSMAAALALVYSSYANLHIQLGILVISGLISTVSFVIVDRQSSTQN